ncbi:hypothetical protein AKJ38_03885 [candidate division MSBL1 archaeon SCGC-AAA259I14]|uniref:Metal-dependent hydrolase n=1 Tax=candidate division MSBL1 archaeon SCGC-AAA259I14 TaxID=1698268 RepID=A0A133UPP3_9EURY|nr:hypothetical protein AKJ38_03885 [candidate division MSBL1 archaeon SCGC-AAA259I14]
MARKTIKKIFQNNLLIFLAVAVSSVPDLDLDYKYFDHRGKSHSIGAAFIFGVGFGLILFYANEAVWGVLGFLSGFGGFLSHLIGDLFNYDKFPILWPFMGEEKSLKKFKSKEYNRVFLYIGIFCLVLYVLVTQETLQTIIQFF